VPPALFVNVDSEALEQIRDAITSITDWTRLPGSAAAACTRAIACPLRMSLADPSAIVAARANSHVHLGAMHTGDQPKCHLSGKGSSLGAKTSWLHGLQMQ
jgi:hypothetical protein